MIFLHVFLFLLHFSFKQLIPTLHSPAICMVHFDFYNLVIQEKVMDSSAKPSSQLTPRPNGPPYAMPMIPVDSDDGISYQGLHVLFPFSFPSVINYNQNEGFFLFLWNFVTWGAMMYLRENSFRCLVIFILLC